MAIRYAIANGNWSDVSTWDGGTTLPTVGDDVYANGCTVSINQNITVIKISTEVCPTTSVGGGGFFLVNLDQIISCNVISGISDCLTHVATNKTLNIIGNVSGSDTTSGKIGLKITGGNPCNINIVGNIYGGAGLDSYGVSHTQSYGTCNLSIVGNLISSVNSEAIKGESQLVYTNISITGNVIPNGDKAGIYFFNALSVIGYITKTSTQYGALARGTLKTANISGICDIIDGLLPVANYTSGIIYVIFNSNITLNIITGINSFSLYSADVLENPPAESDVRSGIIYGIGDAYEGTLAVPPKASVALNVPVDNTVGELVTATTPADFIAALKADDLGVRLGKCATTEEVDSTVAAYNT